MYIFIYIFIFIYTYIYIHTHIYILYMSLLFFLGKVCGAVVNNIMAIIFQMETFASKAISLLYS